MHELSIAMNIVEIAEENARKEGAKTVTEIELEIGKGEWKGKMHGMRNCIRYRHCIFSLSRMWQPIFRYCSGKRIDC